MPLGPHFFLKKPLFSWFVSSRLLIPVPARSQQFLSSSLSYTINGEWDWNTHPNCEIGNTGPAGLSSSSPLFLTHTTATMTRFNSFSAGFQAGLRLHGPHWNLQLSHPTTRRSFPHTPRIQQRRHLLRHRRCLWPGPRQRDPGRQGQTQPFTFLCIVHLKIRSLLVGNQQILHSSSQKFDLY